MKRPIKVNIVLLVVLLSLPFGAGAQQPDRHSLELTWGVSIPLCAGSIESSRNWP